MEHVEYRLIKGFPGYAVGDDGSVWSWRWGYWHETKQSTTAKGYRQVTLARGIGTGNQHPTAVMVHRLVLTAFVGPRPDGYQCRHLDGDPANNRLENLVWGTAAENMADRKKHGRPGPRGEQNGHSVLTEDRVSALRKARGYGVPYETLARIAGMNQRTIYCAVNGISWKHITTAEVA